MEIIKLKGILTNWPNKLFFLKKPKIPIKAMIHAHITHTKLPLNVKLGINMTPLPKVIPLVNFS